MSRARDIADLAGSADAGGLTGRNLIINGAMTVAQRGTSSTGVTSGGYETVDRFRTANNGTPDQLELTHEQSTDAPTGFSNSLKLTVTTAETTLGANERIRLQQRIEGQNLQHLKYGTSDAEYLTLSFYVKSNVTGTYGIHFDNRDSSRSVCSSYTISAANTWEKKTVSIAGDTTGSFDNDNARSLDVSWVLAAGTNYTSGTFATSWESSTNANNAPSGQADITDTVSNYFQITGIQLEVGETATPFEHENFGTTLRKCQRYYEKIGGGAAYDPIGQGSQRTTSETYFQVYFKQTKRTAPTVGFINNVIVTDRLAFDQVVSSIGANHPSVFGFHGHFNHSAVGSVNRPLFVCSGPTSPFGYMTFDSEL